MESFWVSIPENFGAGSPFTGKFQCRNTDIAGAGEGLIGKPRRLYGEHWMIIVDFSKEMSLLVGRGHFLWRGVLYTTFGEGG